MDQNELASIETELRSALTQAGLQWVIDELDRAIAEGVPRERVLRRRRRAAAEPMDDDYSNAYVVADLTSDRDARAAKRAGTLVITTEPGSTA